jgi:hypothetical protein
MASVLGATPRYGEHGRHSVRVVRQAGYDNTQNQGRKAQTRKVANMAQTKPKPTVQAVTRDEWYETTGLTRHLARQHSPRKITITDHRVRHASNLLDGAQLTPTDVMGVYEYDEKAETSNE